MKMDKQTAKDVHRKCLAELTDINVRNLMEHAANTTPILPRDQIDFYYECGGAG